MALAVASSVQTRIAGCAALSCAVARVTTGGSLPGMRSRVGPAEWKRKRLAPWKSKMARVLTCFLKISNIIDAANERIGRATCWLVLLAVLISSTNAVVRYVFSTSSNAWLELQWYLLAAIIMLCAGYTLRHNEHVRIDIVFSRLRERTRIWLDILGALFFLLPVCVVIGVLSWPAVVELLCKA